MFGNWLKLVFLMNDGIPTREGISLGFFFPPWGLLLPRGAECFSVQPEKRCPNPVIPPTTGIWLLLHYRN